MSKKPLDIKKIDKHTAEIRLYGYVGSEQVNADSFLQAVNELESRGFTRCNLRVNSGGGSVFEGIAIFNAIRNSSIEFDCYVDGIAASMMSAIAVSCKKIYMSRLAMIMTHRPTGAALGNPDQLRSAAEMLEKIEDNLCTIYSERTGLSVDDVKDKYLGSSDNWLTAKEALDQKIIDGVYDAPKALAPPPPTMRAEKDLVDYFTNSYNQIHMKQFLLNAQVVALLGIDPTASDDAVNNAIEDLAAKANNYDAAASELSATKTENAELKNKLNQIEETKAEVAIDNLVNGAVADKKITAAEKDKYAKLAKADFVTTKELLDNMKPFNGLQHAVESADANVQKELEELAKMNAKDIWLAGKFERLKQLSASVYQTKYQEFIKENQ